MMLNLENRQLKEASEAKMQAALQEANEVNAMYLLDMPVFSINEAEAIGVVKNIIIDPVEKCLLALAVDKRGWYHDVRVIPAAKIRSIGEDVINIDEKQSAQRAVNLPRIVENMHKFGGQPYYQRRRAFAGQGGAVLSGARGRPYQPAGYCRRPAERPLERPHQCAG